MPSVALRTARQAAREAAAAAAAAQQQQQLQQQQQQIILQQRPTSVIVASASFGSPLTAADFGIGKQQQQSSAVKEKQVSADEAESILSLVSLPMLGNNNKQELYRSSSLKKLAGSSSSSSCSSLATVATTMINAPTANLFNNRPKPITDTLFSFSAASATATSVGGGQDAATAGGPTDVFAVPAAAKPVVVQSAEPAAVAGPSGIRAATLGGGGVNFVTSAKEFSMEEDTLLRELFGDMAESGTEMEKLSPFIGDVVVLKEPCNGEGVGGRGGGGLPLPLSSHPLPMDIQVIDFGPAGAGFDDYEIPMIFGGGGEYKVKAEPGLEVDLKDFPELLAPLSPSQETPLHQEGPGDGGGDIFRRRRTASTTGTVLPPVKCEVDRGSPEAQGFFWSQLQVRL
jgi:hypothetical protein